MRIDPENAHVEVIGQPILGAEVAEGFLSISETEREQLKAVKMLKSDGAPATVGRFTISGDDLYLAGTPWLQRIRGVVKRQ